MITTTILECLNQHKAAPQTLEQLAVATGHPIPDIRAALHRLCSEFQAHLVRPGGEFAYLPGPHPRHISGEDADV